MIHSRIRSKSPRKKQETFYSHQYLYILTSFGAIKSTFLCNYLSLGSSSEESDVVLASLRFATISINQSSIAKSAEKSKYPRIMHHILDPSFRGSVQTNKSRSEERRVGKEC